MAMAPRAHIDTQRYKDQRPNNTERGGANVVVHEARGVCKCKREYYVQQTRWHTHTHIRLLPIRNVNSFAPASVWKDIVLFGLIALHLLSAY